MDKSAGFDLRKPFVELGLIERVVLLFAPHYWRDHACRRFVVREQLLERAHEGLDVLRDEDDEDDEDDDEDEAIFGITTTEA